MTKFFIHESFSHEAVQGILMWRLNILDEDNLPNKAGKAYVNLYHGEWRTNEIKSIDPQGFDIRGFKGDYTFELKRGEEVLHSLEFVLNDDIEIECNGNDYSTSKCSLRESNQ